MSVLIKGMDVPNRCFACPLCFGKDDDWSCAISHGPYIEYRAIATDMVIDTRPDWCPLVPVPPHGRLIDADELYKEALKRSETMDGYYNCLESVISCYTIDNAPTIIPASEEGE